MIKGADYFVNKIRAQFERSAVDGRQELLNELRHAVNGRAGFGD
jgi:hypothetical protein